jgi:hypothetical protein
MKISQPVSVRRRVTNRATELLNHFRTRSRNFGHWPKSGQTANLAMGHNSFSSETVCLVPVPSWQTELLNNPAVGAFKRLNTINTNACD